MKATQPAIVRKEQDRQPPSMATMITFANATKSIPLIQFEDA